MKNQREKRAQLSSVSEEKLIGRPSQWRQRVGVAVGARAAQNKTSPSFPCGRFRSIPANRKNITFYEKNFKLKNGSDENGTT